MPRRAIQALVTHLRALARDLGLCEDSPTSSNAEAIDEDDTFVYDLKADLDHGRN